MNTNDHKNTTHSSNRSNRYKLNLRINKERTQTKTENKQILSLRLKYLLILFNNNTHTQWMNRRFISIHYVHRGINATSDIVNTVD